MIKEGIAKLLEVATAKTYEVEGTTFSDKPLHEVKAEKYRLSKLRLGSLDGVVKMIKAEAKRNLLTKPLFVMINDYNKVEIITTFDEDKDREFLYLAEVNPPGAPDHYLSHEEMIIALQSRFVANEGTQYLLNLLSKITSESNVSTSDNGVSQTVEARQGIALQTKEKVKPIVKLVPYRTFLEVKQPESSFLVRIKEGGSIGLFEADGGMWKLQAKESIKAYFEKELADQIALGNVVLTV